MKFWDHFPSKEKLLGDARKKTDVDLINVNAHIHTPYSFSAFDSIGQAIKLASDQDVQVVGINDFYTVDGFQTWAESCKKHHLFPLFNIEFIGLSKSDQQNNIRINDPENPGRIYLSGKGLSYPFHLEGHYLDELSALKTRSNHHVKLMCDRLNDHLKFVKAGFQLDFNAILNKHTKRIIRERHLAKALREKVYGQFIDNVARKKLLTTIFNGRELLADINQSSAVENEIRAIMLKSGGAAFVPENPDSFLSPEMIMDIILHAGGIPTYPLLADNKNGKFTEFEEDIEKLAKELLAKEIFSVEFIPIRNSIKVLEEYASFFEDKGFIVSFGSEHNTPDLSPLKLYTRDSIDLSEKLKAINYRGACIIAAHQYLDATEGRGYIQADGKPLTDDREQFMTLGNRLIHSFISA